MKKKTITKSTSMRSVFRAMRRASTGVTATSVWVDLKYGKFIKNTIKP